MKKQLITALLCFLASTAQAEAEGWYVGLQDSLFTAELETFGDADINALSVFVGKEINPYFALEFLAGAGLSDDEADIVSVDVELASIASFSAVGSIPIGPVFRPYGKFGVAHLRYSDSNSNEADATGFTFTAGLAFDLTEKMGLNIDYTIYPEGEYDEFKEKIDAKTVSFGAYLRF